MKRVSRGGSLCFWRSLTIWALIPGNILALILLIHLQYKSADVKTVVVYRHVYHTDQASVWSAKPQSKASLSLRATESVHFEDTSRITLSQTPEDPEATELLHQTNFEELDLSEELAIDSKEEEEEEEVESTDMKSQREESVESSSEDNEDEHIVEDSVQIEEGEDISETEEEDDVENYKDSGEGEFVNLPVQVKPTNRRTFANFRSSSCTYMCETLKQNKWKLVSKAPSMILLRWYSYDKYKSWKKTMINHVGQGSACIGGGKGAQLKCKQDFVRQTGKCEYNDLKVQPRQWNIQDTSECKAFFQHVEHHPNRIFIRKPGGSQHGKGITLHNGIEGLSSYKSCKRKLKEGVILQEYLEKPLLLGGHKFDLRTYLLVASTHPFLVFYHEGFIRRSERPFVTNSSSALADVKVHVTNSVKQSSENHFFSFEQVGNKLAKEHGFDPAFFHTRFQQRAMKVTEFLVRSAGIERRRGRFQLFALDWMIDEKGNSFLLEANGDPSVVHYPDIGLTPDIWNNLYDLVEKVHTTPSELKIPRKTFDSNGMPTFKYGRWQLVYNEYANDAAPISMYNPCTIFSP